MRFNWGKILLMLSLIFSIVVFYASNVKNNNALLYQVFQAVVVVLQWFWIQITHKAVHKTILSRLCLFEKFVCNDAIPAF